MRGFTYAIPAFSIARSMFTGALSASDIGSSSYELSPSRSVPPASAHRCYSVGALRDASLNPAAGVGAAHGDRFSPVFLDRARALRLTVAPVGRRIATTVTAVRAMPGTAAPPASHPSHFPTRPRSARLSRLASAVRRSRSGRDGRPAVAGGKPRKARMWAVGARPRDPGAGALISSYITRREAVP